MSSTCAKPSCSETAVAWLVANPRDQLVEILDHDSSQGMRLCAAHVERFSVPDGWRRMDHRDEPDEPSRSDEPRAAWFVTDLRDEPASDPSIPPVPVEARGHLLNRAFNGPDSVVAAGRLSRLERVHDQVDRVPDRVGEREQQERNDHRHSKGEGDHRNHGDVGPRGEYAADEDHEQDEERQDGVDAYSTDELPFPPFEGKLAPRAAVG